MLVEWFNLFERLVVAIEKVAETKACGGCDTVVAQFQQGDPVPPGLPLQQETANSQADRDAKALKRETIKSELRALGITFNASAKTESLEKILEANRGKKQGPAFVSGTDDTPTAEPTGNLVVTATKDQAREALVALSATFGKDVGLEILRTEGKAEKLVDVDPSRYAFIVDACRRKEAQANV